MSETRICGAQLREGYQTVKGVRGGPTLLTEQRREDPLIFALDAVVSQH